MVVSPNVITVAKYGFLSLVVTGAGLLISSVIVVKHQKVSGFADSLVYNQPNSVSTEDPHSLLNRNYGRCLTNPSKSFCLFSDKKRLKLLRSKDPDAEMENTSGPPMNDKPKNMPRPIHSLLLEFGKFMTSLKVTPVLLEPSMIYCLLSPSNKLNLIKNGFNPNKLQGSRKVVTFGIFEKDANILDKESSLIEFASSAGFTFSQFLSGPDTLDSGHYFFKRMGLTVHCVVLFEKQGFLRIAELLHQEVDLEGLLFVKEAIYENFTSVRLPIEISPELIITIPSDPIQFLYQLPISKFLECSSEESIEDTVVHPDLTQFQLQNRVRVGLQELKAQLYPHFISFWLWDDTLKGWNGHCNIFTKTTELNLAVSYTAVKRINLTNLLSGNDYLHIIPRIQLPGGNTLDEDAFAKVALDCYGLKINIFICFEEKNSVSSYVNTDSGATYRIIHPKFHLCSAEVYGQRVHVPCQNDSGESSSGGKTQEFTTQGILQENLN